MFAQSKVSLKSCVCICSSVCEQTDEKLGMKVGVNCGRVFSGLLGSNGWHYDVWSDDVEIANQTEIGGIPGYELFECL